MFYTYNQSSSTQSNDNPKYLLFVLILFTSLIRAIPRRRHVYCFDLDWRI